jgi:hypothetical protein
VLRVSRRRDDGYDDDAAHAGAGSRGSRDRSAAAEYEGEDSERDYKARAH